MSEIKIPDLCNMKLHEETEFGRGSLIVLRVPGGWIYTHHKKVFCEGVGYQIAMTSTFVPEYSVWGHEINTACSTYNRKSRGL